MKFEQPISADRAFEIDLLDAASKTSDLLLKLYLISREAIGGSAIDRFWDRREATSRYVMAQVLLMDSTLKLVRRTLRTQFAGLKITEDEVAQLLRDEVVKREVLEGDKAEQAGKMLRRAQKKRAKERAAAAEVPGVAPSAKAP